MYDLSLFFWYRPIFMTELLIAESIFLMRLQKREGYWWRLILALLIAYGISFATPYFDNAYYQSLIFFMFFAVSFAVAFIPYKAKLNTLLFCSIAGYNLQHCAYELYSLSLIGFGLSETGAGDFYSANSGDFFAGPWHTLLYFAIYLFLYWGAFIFFATKIKKDENLHIKSVGMFVLTTVCILSDILINSMVLYYQSTTTSVILFFIDSLSVILCLVVMALQFELADSRQLTHDLEVLERIRQKEKEQLSASKENIALINMKCHDLKNQIHEIGENKSISNETIEDIKNVISIFDSTVKTGDETLDIILSEKSLLCFKEHIKFTCICDGESLSFMKEEDVYSLFGNIVDNAIEAVKNLIDDKKVISLSVKKIKSFVQIKADNYFENKKLHFDNGIPLSTKRDSINHGFGMQSMRYVTEKYGGSLECGVLDEIFSLSVLIPLSIQVKENQGIKNKSTP